LWHIATFRGTAHDLSDVCICNIALQAGFSDISHFNRLFRYRFGGTPSDVRVEAHNISIQEVKRTHKARVDRRTSEGSDADQF